MEDNANGKRPLARRAGKRNKRRLDVTGRFHRTSRPKRR